MINFIFSFDGTLFLPKQIIIYKIYFAHLYRLNQIIESKYIKFDNY